MPSGCRCCCRCSQRPWRLLNCLGKIPDALLSCQGERLAACLLGFRSAKRGIMRQPTVVLVLAAASLGAVLSSAQNASPPSARIRGFSAASSAAELAREREVQAPPNAA